ncbi:VTT domain-containing protein [Candidatus Poribacteria bacterium]
MLNKTRYERTLLYSAIGLSILLAALAVFLPGHRLMIAFFAYTATLNSGLIPFPTMTYAIFLGRSHSPFLVAVVGMLGSAVSSIAMYYLVTKLSKKERVRRIENSRLMKSWKALAHRSPFLSLIMFNAVPFPADPSRFFAIFNRYSVKRYVMAISLGRFVRYFLLAVLGEACRIPNSALIALTVMLIVLPFLARKCKKRLKHRSEIAHKEGECEFSIAR